MKKSLLAAAVAAVAVVGTGCVPASAAHRAVPAAKAAPATKRCRGHYVRVAYGESLRCDVRPPQVLITTFPTFDGDEHAKVVAICEDLGGYPVFVNRQTATAECQTDY